MKMVLSIILSLLISFTASSSDSSSCSRENTLEENLAVYFGINDSENELRKTLGCMKCLNIITTTSFKNVTCEEYEENLNTITSFINNRPFEINDVLIYLQQDWEKEFLVERIIFNKDKYRKMKLGVLYGLVIGGGASLVRNKWQSYKYKTTLKTLLTIVSAGMGAIGSQAGVQECTIPKAPATLSDFGAIYEDTYILREREHFRQLTSLTAGGAGSVATYAVGYGVKAFRAANLALTPLKINPIILAGSFIIGWGVDKIADKSLYKLDERSQVNKYKNALKLYSAQFSTSTDSIKYTRALAQATNNLLNFYMLPVYAYMSEATEQEEEIDQNKRLSAEIREIRKKEIIRRLAKKVNRAFNKIPNSYKPNILLEKTISLISARNLAYLNLYENSLVAKKRHITIVQNYFKQALER